MDINSCAGSACRLRKMILPITDNELYVFGVAFVLLSSAFIKVCRQGTAYDAIFVY